MMDRADSSQSMSREDLDRAFERHPVVGTEPRRAVFGRLKIHRDRLKLRRLRLEAKVLAQSWVRHDKPKPFVIYGRPRSGTTLLVRLLGQVPGIRCDEELLHFFLLSPTAFVRRLPRRAGAEFKAYGFKLISYHLMDIQRIRRPLAFFDQITDAGYSVIHLTRNTWDQTLSLAKAQNSGVYFDNSDSAVTSLRLDPERFEDLLRWNEGMLDYETSVMAHVPHLEIVYDRDLENAANHQGTIDRICTHLGVSPAQVAAKMKRTGGSKGSQTVENMDEIVAHIRSGDLAHLVPDAYP